MNSSYICSFGLASSCSPYLQEQKLSLRVIICYHSSRRRK